MTTIEYGGGPNLEQRRAFAGLRDFSMIPGYCGHCPHVKYDFGQTYGQSTHNLTEARKPKQSITASYEIPVMSTTTKLHSEDGIPESNGDNKYTKNMVPGYTGYIPRWPFKFGSRYKIECDECLNEHINNLSKQSAKDEDLRKSFQSFPSLQAVRHDPQVRDHLNSFSDHLKVKNIKDDKRASTEPPIPGYKGFVPRIYTTELGLGCRYHDMTRNGLESFYSHVNRRRPVGRSVTFADSVKDDIPQEMLCGCYQRIHSSTADLTDSDKRLYKRDGMIPKYTGYLPQKQFSCGYTYGDTSRSLDVCTHNQACYGDYVKTLRQSPYIG